MKALIQRVLKASVTVEGTQTASIGRGYAILLGVRTGDTAEQARELARKTVNLRIFPDSNDKMNLSIQDISGEILIVSQFTLYADTRKGNRPSFIDAAPPETAEPIYNTYVEAIRKELGASRVATGIFRASMELTLTNDGPVTIELQNP
jgi:D-tyrosyl-tRNA(Tyr) deacylase